MMIAMRGLVALCLAASILWAGGADAGQQALASERDRISYMIGLDLGRSIESVGPDLDYAAVERAIAHALEGGEPLVEGVAARQVSEALMQRAASRAGQPVPGMPPGMPAPDVDPEQAGLLVGADLGSSLVPLRDEFDLPVLVRALRAGSEGGEPLMSEAEAAELRRTVAARIQERARAEAARLGDRNRAEGEAFLAENRHREGVVTTRSGLQYTVIRPGSGQRPLPHNRVRVHYHGTLLDGTVFDSSYDRNEPTEFSLSQVIPGWSEGVALMPVGAKYRFWVPGHLAYGPSGTPGGPIGPHATLVFDVELLDVL